MLSYETIPMHHHDISPGRITPAPRLNIYANIHKGLRAMMMDTLACVGSVDIHDSTQLPAVCERVLELCDICTSHMGHEHEFVHAAMQACQPGSAAQIAAEHQEHLAVIAELRETVSRPYSGCSGPMQEQAALELYRKLALFVAENFVHMHAEEVEHVKVLWACYNDEELHALEERIVASMPPADTLMHMRWMIPAMAPVERAALLSGMQAVAPARVFSTVLDTVQPHLSHNDWSKLTRALASTRASMSV
ncbi:hypothetical protein [Ottowia thiooxydans]|uniref:hypothetical protein n=1 Tax=Ottowia thiooxydans TaxID=219182 RepID=UPI00042A0F52|nr:hypothetical protein [Ottowia thiooxydans]